MNHMLAPIETICRGGRRMAVIIDLEKCTGCGLCRKNCPYGAVGDRG